MRTVFIHFVFPLLLLALPTLAESHDNPIMRSTTNGALVGTISGKAEVSPIGAATYTIPLDLPKGCGGLTPELSINYNSLSNLSNMGWRCALGGISQITRVPRDLYHDNEISAVDFSDNDCYALDGVRLMRNSPTDTVFYPELNNTARVVSDSPTNPQRFKVYSPDGVVTTFGSSENSQVQGKGEDSGKVLIWKADRVEDANGNYYTIEYTINDDRRLNRIDYSANSKLGLEPSLCVSFEYTSNGGDFYDTYINTTSILKSGSVSKISISKGSKVLRKYDISYNKTAYPTISEITLTGSDGISKYNPTQFNWNDPNQTVLFDQHINSLSFNSDTNVKDTKHYIGDFNGDGISEIMLLSTNNRNWEGWRICDATASVLSFTSNFKFNQPEITELIPGDFNGDGKSDFIAVPKGDKPTLHLYYSSSTNSTFRFTESSTWTTYTIPDKTERGYLSGDFNGDGVSDLLIYKKNNKDYTVLFSEIVNGEITPLSRIETHSISHKWDDVHIGDFNGDGINDIYNLHSAESKTDGPGTDIIIFGNKSNSPKNKHFTNVDKFTDLNVVIDTFTGDFNGDGKTDIFVVHPGISRVYYSNGNGLTQVACNFVPYRPADFNGFIADINGDGKDDFYIIKTDVNDNLILKAVINTDCGKQVWSSYDIDIDDVKAEDFCLGDFKGSGKTSLLSFCEMKNGNGESYKASLIVSPKYEMPLLVTVTDGLGAKTEFSYSKMREYPVSSTETLTYPYRNPKNQHMNVVSSMTDGQQRNSYSYADGLFHMTGRGFIGFKKFILSDNNSNIKTTATFKLDNTFCMLGIDSTETAYINPYKGAISKTDYNNQVVTLWQGTKMFQTTGVTTQNFDINTGNLESTKTEVSTFNQYGNELTKTETTNGNDLSVTSNTYINYSDRYIYGLPQATTTTLTRDGQTSISSTETKHYRNGEILPWRTSMTTDDGLSSATDFSYDFCGNILSEKSAYEAVSDSVTKFYTYDADKRLITKIVENGNYVTSYSYNSQTDDIDTETGADGIITKYETDAFGRKTKSTTINGTKSGILYWAKGIDNSPFGAVYAVEKKTTDQPDVIDFYNEHRQKIRSITTLFGEKTVFTDYVYDSNNGKILKEYEPYFSDEQPKYKFYQYDILGRILSILFPDGSTETHTYENSQTLGNKHLITDRNGKTTETISNVYNEPISTTDADGNVTLYSYNSRGNCTEVRGSRTSIEMEYDGYGNCTKMTDTDRGVISYKYNARKNLIQQEETGRGTILYKYNANGDVTERNINGGVLLFDYHPSIKNRLLRIKTQGGYNQYSYSYDAGNHITREIRAQGSDTMQMRFYYEKDLLKQIIYPDGFSVTNEFTNGTLSKVRHTLEADKIYWQLDNVDSQNRPTCYTLGGNKIVRIRYDSETGRPVYINNAGKIVHTYSYDRIGNMLSHSDSINNQSETFVYDNLYRLISSKNADSPADEISYDASGNILSKTSIGTIAYFDQSNQIDKVNVTSGIRLKQWPQIEYNSLNKVTTIKNSLSNLAITYGLDDEKAQTFEVFAAIQTRKYFGKYYDHLSYYSDEMTYTSTCHIFAGDKEICTITNGDYNSDIYKYYDAMGSVVGLYDKRSDRLQQFSYDAWGRARSVTNWNQYTNSYPVGIGYCGHEYVGLFELIDMRGRMYDPVIGRFISPDPYVQDPANSQNLNRYTYCLNNPLKYTDPTGEFFIIDDFLIGMTKGLIEGGWKRGWRDAKKLATNSAKIWAGLYATGAGRNFWSASWELISRFTYQIPQTTLGFFAMQSFNTIGGALKRTGHVQTKYGATVLPTNLIGGEARGITIGNFINGSLSIRANKNNQLFLHEYGHYLQSREIGFAFIPLIGIPSLVSATFWKGSHKKFFTETWANRNAYGYFKKLYGSNLNWNHDIHPLYRGEKASPYGISPQNSSQQEFCKIPEYGVTQNQEIYNW